MRTPSSKALTKDLERWYPLPELKPVHKAYMNCERRFILIKAGRRSYKTEIAKRLIIEAAMEVPGNYFIAAPTIPQVRLIYWDDIKRMSFPSLQKCVPKEGILMRPFDNGSTIQLMGMDNPKRFEGPYWTGGILDEFAYYKEEAWAESIRPALDTVVPGLPLPWCIILSKPNGHNHFFDRYQYAKNSGDPNWQMYEWTSEDVLSEDAIASAKRELSKKQYAQEYLGEFVSTSGRIYDEYSSDNHIRDTIKEHEQICYFCDFNFTPMSHGIAVFRDHHTIISSKKVVKAVYVLDEIILESARGEHNALEFVERYKHHKNKSLRLYGDRSGKNGEKHSLDSEYIAMERVFRKHGWEVDRRVQNANPSIKGSQSAVNAKIRNTADEITLFVDPIGAPWMDEGLYTVVVKEGSSFLEDDKNDKQHITTALRYMVNYEWPIDDQIMTIDIGWGNDNPDWVEAPQFY